MFKILEEELLTFETDYIKKFTEIALNNVPRYFYEIPASLSGKYHPKYTLGEGGLVRHTKGALRIANHLLSLEQYKNLFYTQIERDLIRASILLHDAFKQGDYESGQTKHNHPNICADWLLKLEQKENPSIYVKVIADNIRSHMGEWNVSKYDSNVLEKPKTESQKFVHLCDYLASRKDIEILMK